MKVVLLTIGKSSDGYLNEGIANYTKRINRYNKFEIIELSSLKKNKSRLIKNVKNIEGEILLNNIKTNDYVVLLDSKGVRYTSEKFALKIQSLLNMTSKRIIFVVGGAYGFSKEVIDRCNEKISFSEMTFSHQMIRLFFVEQLYRGYTILKNEPYHHS